MFRSLNVCPNVRGFGEQFPYWVHVHARTLVPTACGTCVCVCVWLFCYHIRLVWWTSWCGRIFWWYCSISFLQYRWSPCVLTTIYTHVYAFQVSHSEFHPNSCLSSLFIKEKFSQEKDKWKITQSTLTRFPDSVFIPVVSAVVPTMNCKNIL